MSRSREIQRLRQEIELIDKEQGTSELERVRRQAQLEHERADLEEQVATLKEESTRKIRRTRAEAERELRQGAERAQRRIDRERERADRLESDVARLNDSLTSARQEAAGHRLLRRELELQLQAAKAERDAAVARLEELAEVVRASPAPEDHVIRLDDYAREAHQDPL